MTIEIMSAVNDTVPLVCRHLVDKGVRMSSSKLEDNKPTPHVLITPLCGRCPEQLFSLRQLGLRQEER